MPGLLLFHRVSSLASFKSHLQELTLIYLFAEPFGNPSFAGTANASCHSNIFNGTADLVSQTSPSTSPTTNYTTYDNWVKQATPLVLTAFTKNATEQTPR
jgi:hypothetical protein